MREKSARRSLSPLFVAAVALALAVAWPAFADSVTTESDNGFGRIVFTLDPLAHATPAVTGGVLTISFDRKISIEPSAVMQGLNGYLSAVHEDADGKTFRFALTQNVRLHTSTSADKIAIDLVPAGFDGDPPDLPPPPPVVPTAVEVSKLPVLPVRAGAYSNFTRLVFDWPKNVSYAVFPGAGKLTIRFEDMARPDFSAFESVSPPWVKQAGWRIENQATIIDFDTDAATGYHDFRDGTKVVLDILAPKTDAASYRPPTTDGAKPGVTQLSAQAQAIADTAAKLNGTPPSAPAPAKPQANATAQTPAANGPPTALPGTTPAATAPGANPQAQAAQPPATQPAPPTQGADAHATRGGAVLTFAKAGSRPAAVFVRGLTAWIVLDGALPLDPAKLKSELGNFTDSLEASSGDGVSILRIALKQPEQISAVAQGDHLKVVIAPQATSNATAIGYARDTDEPSQATLTTLLPGATHAVEIADPVAGDTLTVIPALAGRAQTAPDRFVEFATLQTAAGLVITPFCDDLDVKVSGSRVAITRPGGLKLSPPPSPPATSPAALAASESGPAFLDFASWAATDGSFEKTQAKLRDNIAKVASDEANPARLTLARFYLANGFAAETLGLIDLMQQSDPQLKDDRQLQTMRAAADYMMGRYQDAHNDIAGAAFDGDRNIAFWRGLTEAALEDWDGARAAFAMADPAVRHYTPTWQARARIAEAQTWLALRNIEMADAALSRMPGDLPAPLMLQAELQRARLFGQEGRLTAALPLFKAVEAGSDDEAAAESIYYRVETSLAAGAMTDDQAIAVLDELRFRWRGDALELKTLRKLGALYFAKKQWRNGFDVLRTASQNFPNSDLARQAQDDMRTAFENLFLKGGADKMPPVEALALFYDNLDLTPIGTDGDEMIRRMTDRLVAVDLLEPAEKLLDYQVNKRLDGAARAQVAGRLAMIQLLDRKPKDALATLNATDMTGLPDDVNHERLILKARALAAMKQWDQALDLIAVDEAPDSRELRADIYWESGNWDVAGQKTEELLATRWSDPAALSDKERGLVMRAAIAYSLAGDQTSLDRLHDHFSSKMAASPDANAFAVVTQDIDSHGVAFRDLASRIASVDTFENFMKDFRAHYDTAPKTN